MRAVLVHVSDAELEHRRRTGIDRWDEMWEGVLHMAPAPNVEHQRIVDRLVRFLGRLLEATGLGSVISGINVFRDAGAVEDYRIPDLTFVAAGREGILAEDGVRGGPPDAALEVRSPHDETYEKLSFFATLGIREVVVVDRDTKRPEVFRLAGSHYVAVAEDADGAVRSGTLGVLLRALADPPPRLLVEDTGESGASVEI